MTNGEKFKEVFKPSQVDEGDYFAFARWSNYHAAEISIGWWNAEYKEPTTKNDLGVDAISRIETIDYLCKHCPDDGECFKDCDEIKHLRNLPSVTPQEPIAWIVGKNNAKIAVKNMPIDKLQKICAIIGDEQEPILDKIREEIKVMTSNRGFLSCSVGYIHKEIDNVFDKYKAESEG